MFDGFAMPFKPTIDTSNKEYIEISKLISTIMHNYSSVEDVKKYLEKINLKDLTNSMLVFIDKDGKYLRVESD
jgi:penicillin V acylase-like amidase (Ntn superfamily)